VTIGRLSCTDSNEAQLEELLECYPKLTVKVYTYSDEKCTDDDVADVDGGRKQKPGSQLSFLQNIRNTYPLSLPSRGRSEHSNERF